MTTQTATLQERATEKKDSLKSLKASVGQRHFNGPVCWPEGFRQELGQGLEQGWPLGSQNLGYRMARPTGRYPMCLPVF